MVVGEITFTWISWFMSFMVIHGYCFNWLGDSKVAMDITNAYHSWTVIIMIRTDVGYA
jgi:hypothetical protein